MAEIGLISIVIPALNEEKFLPACLRSLKEQDYGGDYEIIIADNGSTDNTAEVARSYGAKLVSCSQKKSVFYARQAGADAASGDIIAQADADSIYPRDWLRRIADRFAAHPEVVAVTGRFIYADPPFWARLEYWLRSTTNRVTQFIIGRPLVISGATFAFRRDAFLTGDGYHGLDYAADQYGIAARLSKQGKIACDTGLLVTTSARSVKKSFARVTLDFGGHLGRWALHTGGTGLGSLAAFLFKTPARRIAFPLSTMALMFFAIGYFIPQSDVFGKVYSEIKTTQPMVALTFDDGPNEPYTSQILDILDGYGIKATFFLIGKNVLLYPEVARRMRQQGHVIGNHSFSHIANHALLPMGNDIRLAQEAIFNTVGVEPHLYRPPHGKKTPWELQEVARAGLVEVNWTVATNEIRNKGFQSVATRIVNKTDPGEIILLHDGYGTDHNIPQADKSLTVNALPLIIEQLQARGYRFVTVPELLNLPAYNQVRNEP